MALDEILNAAIAAHDAGELESAESGYRRVLERDPDNFDALHLLGYLNIQGGDHERARQFSERALTVRDNNPHTHHNLGIANAELGRRAEAVANLATAVALDPAMFEAHLRLGGLHLQSGNYTDALASFSAARELDDGDLEVHAGLFEAHHGRNEYEPSVAALERAIEIKPDMAELHYSLGTIRTDKGYYAQSLENFRQTLTLKPDYIDAYVNMGVALMYINDHQGALRCFLDARNIDPDNDIVSGNLLLLYNYLPDVPPEDVRAEAIGFGERQCAKAGPAIRTSHDNTPDPNRRLKVGFVSGDFRDHPVGYLLRDIVAKIDENDFELFAYNTFPHSSSLTDYYRSVVPNWCEASGMDDDRLAERISVDAIDVLVDLSGHMAYNRLAVFARKPAPVQATWLGYVSTTGISAIDYIIGDPVTLQAGGSEELVETPWRMPVTAICYSPPDNDIEPGPPPVEKNGCITFGSFNNFAKLTQNAIETWTRVLVAVPDSRLVLKSSLAKKDAVDTDTIRDRFAADGIDLDRIELECCSPRNQLFQRYQEIDIALDPFPFPGVTTSMDALWMGVPVLTCKGDRFCSRMSDSILHTIGREAWIAAGPDDLVDKAVSLASDPQALATIRSTLRDRFMRSRICDAAAFADDLGNAFRGMWRAYCAKAGLSQS